MPVFIGGQGTGKGIIVGNFLIKIFDKLRIHVTNFGSVTQKFNFLNTLCWMAGCAAVPLMQKALQQHAQAFHNMHLALQETCVPLWGTAKAEHASKALTDRPATAEAGGPARDGCLGLAWCKIVTAVPVAFHDASGSYQRLFACAASGKGG